MSKENQKTSHTDVMPALANFAQEIYFQGDIKELPSEMQEICDRLLETEHADELHIRLKMLRCKETINLLAKTIEPFSYEEIMLLAQRYPNV